MVDSGPLHEVSSGTPLKLQIAGPLQLKPILHIKKLSQLQLSPNRLTIASLVSRHLPPLIAYSILKHREG